MDLVEVAGLSERKVATSLDTMDAAVRSTAAMLMSDEEDNPNQGRKIGAALRQKEGEQPYRMAMAMVVNALVFHEVVARSHDVERVEKLLRVDGVGRRQALIDEWRRILEEVNYWPIFATARQVLDNVRTRTAHRVLEVLQKTAAELIARGVGTTHALAGRMFQRLVADRKFLASYYTRSESAARLWDDHASRFHANRGFRLNSQSPAACPTPEPCRGGRAWPTVRPAEDEWTISLLPWMNGALGLVEFRWRGSRRQPGRAIITIRRAPESKARRTGRETGRPPGQDGTRTGEG